MVRRRQYLQRYFSVDRHLQLTAAADSPADLRAEARLHPQQRQGAFRLHGRRADVVYFR